MVLPDRTRFQQDRSRGLIREIHDTLAAAPRVHRNLPGSDYRALLERPDALHLPAQDGYLLGLPYGRHLRLYFEFAAIEPLRRQLAALLEALGRLALERTPARLFVLDYADFAHRHHPEPILLGAQFEEPHSLALLRCRDLREPALPAPPPDIRVRAATKADSDALEALAAQALPEPCAPPLPDAFLGDARWLALAEHDGRTTGCLRLLDAEKRGLTVDELLVLPGQAPGQAPEQTPGQDRGPSAAALLRAAFLHGREHDRRALTLRLPPNALPPAVLQPYDFRHAGEQLRYLRPVDPDVVEQRRRRSGATQVTVGKLGGRF